MCSRFIQNVSRLSRFQCNTSKFNSGYSSRWYSDRPEDSRVFTKDDRIKFQSSFPSFADGLMDEVRKFDDSAASKWLEKALQYIVFGADKQKGELLVAAYKILAKESQLTAENLQIVYNVGWCTELTEATVVVADDIVDNGETRRGFPCWHELESVKMQAVNDVLTLQASVFAALRKHIGHKDYYRRSCERFVDANLATMLGQTLDVINSKQSVTCHTRAIYDRICDLKVCEMGCLLPIALAMDMSGYTDPELFDYARQVSCEIGKVWQMQNDYLDCFADATKAGRFGTDIQENKATWLSINAMERSNQDQRRIMANCYGKTDLAKQAQIKSLYEELELHKYFVEDENQRLAFIKGMIDSSPNVDLKKVLEILWGKIQQRNFYGNIF